MVWMRTVCYTNRISSVWPKGYGAFFDCQDSIVTQGLLRQDNHSCAAKTCQISLSAHILRVTTVRWSRRSWICKLVERFLLFWVHVLPVSNFWQLQALPFLPDRQVAKMGKSSVFWFSFSFSSLSQSSMITAEGITSAADRGGQLGQFALGPQCEGGPQISAELFQIKSCLSFTSQSSFFKRFVSLDFKSASFFASRSRCWHKLQNNAYDVCDLCTAAG